jgi:hypothetical protein
VICAIRVAWAHKGGPAVGNEERVTNVAVVPAPPRVAPARAVARAALCANTIRAVANAVAFEAVVARQAEAAGGSGPEAIHSVIVADTRTRTGGAVVAPAVVAASRARATWALERAARAVEASRALVARPAKLTAAPVAARGRVSTNALVRIHTVTRALHAVHGTVGG